MSNHPRKNPETRRAERIQSDFQRLLKQLADQDQDVAHLIAEADVDQDAVAEVDPELIEQLEEALDLDPVRELPKTSRAIPALTPNPMMRA